jgi:hypothetical protein
MAAKFFSISSMGKNYAAFQIFSWSFRDRRKTVEVPHTSTVNALDHLPGKAPIMSQTFVSYLLKRKGQTRELHDSTYLMKKII